MDSSKTSPGTSNWYREVYKAHLCKKPIGGYPYGSIIQCKECRAYWFGGTYQPSVTYGGEYYTTWKRLSWWKVLICKMDGRIKKREKKHG